MDIKNVLVFENFLFIVVGFLKIKITHLFFIHNNVISSQDKPAQQQGIE